MWIHRKPFFGALFCGVLFAIASGFGLPYLMEKILPKIFHEENQDVSGIILAAMWLPIMMGIRGVTGFGNIYLSNFCGLKVLEEIRVLVFTKLQTLPIAYFKKQKSGDLLSRLMVDCQAVQTMIVNVSNDLIRQPLQFLGALGALIYLAYNNSQLGVILMGMSIAPLIFFPVRIVGKKLLHKAAQLQRQAGQLSSTITDNFQAYREVRAYNLEEREVDKFRHETQSLFEKNMKVVKYVNCLTPINEFLGACAVGGAIAYQGVQGMTFDSMVPLLIALHMAYEPIKKLSAAFGHFQKGKASLERLEEVLYEPDPMEDQKQVRAIPEFESLKFENLNFKYESQDEDSAATLKDLNLEIKANEVVALVGSSGAGKSTFVNLLPRFYDPSSGNIKWNDIDIREFKKSELRDRFSIVSQEPILFYDTIENNIRIGKADAKQDDLYAAAHSAYAHEFILDQPEKYDTLCGERGAKLSGGQKQRIVLARAFLKNAPILILDEATSALDSESEQRIQAALNELIEGKTAFIVAHRFSTIKIASRILVFDKGEIIADGQHDELYRTCDLYKSLCDHQLQQ